MKVLLWILPLFWFTAQCNSMILSHTKKLSASTFFKSPRDYLYETFDTILSTGPYINTDTDNDSDSSIPVMEYRYFGNWQSSPSDFPNQFTDFTGNTGYAVLTAYDENNDGMDDVVYVYFFDGQYIDQKSSVVRIAYDNQTDFNVPNSTFSNSSIIFWLILGDNLEYNTDNNITCEGSYQLSIIDSSTNLPYQISTGQPANAEAYFALNSTNCSISITSVMATGNGMKESKVLYYSLMVTGVCLIHLYATVQLIKHITQNEFDGIRYSLLTLSFFAIWDVFMCLFHLYDALTTQDFFHYFIIPAFWFFILASIFETRLILIVWKTRYYQNFQTVNEVRRGITIFYLKFYGSMLLLLFLAYNFLPAFWFLGLTCIFFVPQIVHNALRGQKYKFDAVYILLLGLLRLAAPLYARSCPVAIFKLTPSYTFLGIYLGLTVLQVIILFLQAKLGSRFFIPRCFLPPKYNYFVKLPSNISPEEVDTCSICMDNLNEAPISSGTQLLVTRPKLVTIMVTPCRHKFHPNCLRQWMEIKLECPFCRAPIPPVD